jgi:hypothetical protein
VERREGEQGNHEDALFHPRRPKGERPSSEMA